MGYCLKSHDDWKHNIILEEVARYVQNEHTRNLGKESFPLHKYLHHGLSSQAMVFNLVGPLIVREDLEPLKVVIERLGVSGSKNLTSAEFEYADRNIFNEDSGQPTSIDLVLYGGTQKIFVEAKLVEREFGGCSVFSNGDCEGGNPSLIGFDKCYLHHIGRQYWQRMQEYGFSESKIASGSICPFINYYQFFREVLVALHESGTFILLHDDRNPAFLKTSDSGEIAGLWPFLIESIPDKHKQSVGRITIQNLVNSIEDTGTHDDWIFEFKRKYGMCDLQGQA